MIQYKKIILFLVLAGFFSACIKIYEPTFNNNLETSNYVVSGLITNQEGYQYVKISQSSSLSTPNFLAIENCVVKVLDNNSNEFQYEETQAGNYRVWMTSNELKTGTLYQLQITTPQGDHLVSNYEEMQKTGSIDSIYYKRKDIAKSDSLGSKNLQGIQFYVDMHGDEQSSEYYKYDLTETWEYHVDQPIIWYYNGYIHHIVPPDYSKIVCWRTLQIGDIFIFSTNNLSKNEYLKGSLSYVDNQTQRLKYIYSLLIRQTSLSKEAYNYWKKLKQNRNLSGGLYSKQPVNIKGNIYNENKPDQQVLGYFGVSAVHTKRIFVEPLKDIIIDAPCCDTTELRFGLRDIMPTEYPAYLTGNEYRYGNGLLGNVCVDCRRMGGSTIKPSFWPNKK